MATRRKADLKTLLARVIAQRVKEIGTQTEAARMALDAPSQLSLICNEHLRGFSTERLLRIATRLGVNVSVIASPAVRGRRAAVMFKRSASPGWRWGKPVAIDS
jgi:hypothetical protein